MATQTVTVSFRLRWWLRAYLAVLVAACDALGREPHEAKLNAIVRRGLVVEVKRTDEVDA